MGRLIYGAHRRTRVWRLVARWGLPICLSVGVLWGVQHAVKADPVPNKSELTVYLQTHELDVTTEGVNGYDQVVYRYNGKLIRLTTDNYNHIDVFSSKQYVVWEGEINFTRQIFSYNVLTGTLLQLTAIGTNMGPYVHDGVVTWQRWDGSSWQIMYFDGSQVHQLTSGPESSVTASTDGKQIIYAEQLGVDHWKAQSYDLATGQTTLLHEGDTPSTAYPHFMSDGTISTAYVPR